MAACFTSFDPRSHRGRWSAVAVLLLTALLPGVLVVGSAGASPTPIDAAARARDPLSGRWGVYTGSADGAYPAWKNASGTTKKLLAKVALQPRNRWYGHWV